MLEDSEGVNQFMRLEGAVPTPHAHLNKYVRFHEPLDCLVRSLERTAHQFSGGGIRENGRGGKRFDEQAYGKPSAAA